MQLEQDTNSCPENTDCPVNYVLLLDTVDFP